MDKEKKKCCLELSKSIQSIEEIEKNISNTRLQNLRKIRQQLGSHPLESKLGTEIFTLGVLDGRLFNAKSALKDIHNKQCK